MSIICPVDNKDDYVQSVPALVAGNKLSGSFSGPSGGVTYTDGQHSYTSGYTHLSGTLSSEIAQTLSAPVPPNEIGFWSLVGWSYLFLFSICIVVGPFLLWPGFKNSIVKNPENQKKTFSSDIYPFLFLMLALGWHPFVWPFIPSLQKKLQERSDYAHRYNQWLEATRKWKKLYYCHRCGVVFNPETNTHFSPNQIKDYLGVFEYE